MTRREQLMDELYRALSNERQGTCEHSGQESPDATESCAQARTNRAMAALYEYFRTEVAV